MPLTNLALVEQYALHPDPVALTNGERMAEKAAVRRAAWALKNPEQAARNAETKADWNATRSQAIASGDGRLFQLTTQDCNSEEAKERDRLYWEKYGLFPAAPVIKSKLAA